MRNFPRDRSRILLVNAAVTVVVVALAVAAPLWWTKTIAFTQTAMIAFSIESPDDGSLSSTFIDIEASPADLTKTAELLARAHGRNASDYESDLTITSATDIAGLAVTAQGRTPGAARSLANDAAETLTSYLAELNSTSPQGFTFTVIPAQ